MKAYMKMYQCATESKPGLAQEGLDSTDSQTVSNGRELRGRRAGSHVDPGLTGLLGEGISLSKWSLGKTP